MKSSWTNIVLDHFNINAGVAQYFILRPTTFVFINDLSDVVGSQLDIYTEDQTIYSCLSFKSDISDKVKLATALGKEPHSVTNWGKEWPVSFNLLSFNHHR